MFVQLTDNIIGELFKDINNYFPKDPNEYTHLSAIMTDLFKLTRERTGMTRDKDGSVLISGSISACVYGISIHASNDPGQSSYTII